MSQPGNQAGIAKLLFRNGGLANPRNHLGILHLKVEHNSVGNQIKKKANYRKPLKFTTSKAESRHI